MKCYPATRYVFTLGGHNNQLVSQLQKMVVLSSTKAGNIAMNKANKELIWLKNLMEELGSKLENNRLFSES